MESDELEERPFKLEAWLHDPDEFTEALTNHDILLRYKYER